MARYIDAENMYKEVWKRSTSPLNEWDTWGVLNALDMVKTEDVVPVVHAHWYAKDQWSGFMCSHCGTPEINAHLSRSGEWIHYWKYCPNCGAKMGEGVE